MSATEPPIATADPLVSATLDAGAGQARQETVQALLRSKTFIAGAIIVGFWIVCAITQARFLQDPYATTADILQSPSSVHWFGTDNLGRDVFARVIAGSRDILLVAPAATLLGTLLGTALGLMMGYFGGVVDDVLGRIIDAVLSLPVVIIALLVLVAVGPSNTTAILVIGLLFAPIIARTVRAAVLSERNLDYVTAAKLRNEGALFIMFVEILPNVMQPILVEFTVRLGYAIFTLATLSFLGFGIQPPSPDWGLQIAENYALVSGDFWWPTFFPAAAMATLIVGVNLITDGVSQVVGR